MESLTKLFHKNKGNRVFGFFWGVLKAILLAIGTVLTAGLLFFVLIFLRKKKRRTQKK